MVSNSIDFHGKPFLGESVSMAGTIVSISDKYVSVRINLSEGLTENRSYPAAIFDEPKEGQKLRFTIYMKPGRSQMDIEKI